ncbi:hypothetical protein [Mycobacterium uberis]|uniref:hypothetical protein n=1 Tax=Mycobacterium uberis TaxID=2162698 RepID=UPI0014026055|nr:hypothetical protein [Mycobacterium uberis]
MIGLVLTVVMVNIRGLLRDCAVARPVGVRRDSVAVIHGGLSWLRPGYWLPNWR